MYTHSDKTPEERRRVSATALRSFTVSLDQGVGIRVGLWTRGRGAVQPRQRTGYVTTECTLPLEMPFPSSHRTSVCFARSFPFFSILFVSYEQKKNPNTARFVAWELPITGGTRRIYLCICISMDKSPVVFHIK